MVRRSVPAAAFSQSRPLASLSSSMKRKAAGPDLISRTNAKETYVLTDKELDSLAAEEAANPHRPKGPKQKLYQDAQLEELAIKKWGSAEAFQAERQKRAIAPSPSKPGPSLASTAAGATST